MQMNPTILVAIIGAIATVTVSAGSIWADRRRRASEPRLIESQASQAEADAVATLITGAKDLVDLLTDQLQQHRSEVIELRQQMSEVADQEKRCAEKLESVNKKLDELKNVVSILADQVRGLGGEPNIPDVI